MPLLNEQLAGRPSMTKIDKNKQTPHFRTYSRFDLPQTLYGDRGRRDH